ncbi:MAG: RidA family protein [Spirochaetaceae bacterium]|nr:RidA family protein [Spirochaetaceae bacterium]
MKEVVNTKSAPQAIGPYSQAIKTECFVFISGQIPVDPATGSISGKDIKEQTEVVLKNLKAIVEASGSSINKIVKTTCFLKDINDFPEFNKVYESFFKAGFSGEENSFPARSTLGGLQIPKGALVEIEAVAISNCSS